MTSKRHTLILSFLSAVVGGTIVAACCFFLVFSAGVIGAQSKPKTGAGAGYKMLEDLQCRYGESKHIFVNGVDDNFALGNSEPGKISSRLAHMPGHRANTPFIRDYDETGQDKSLVDHFSIPPKVTRGIFVTRILSKKDYGIDYGNDFIVLGDFSVQSFDFDDMSKLVFTSELNDLSSQDGWSHHGAGLYSAQLKDIIFRFNDATSLDFDTEYSGLLTYLQGQKQDVVIDVIVKDDTVVDFTGFAICTEPKDPLGLTFYKLKTAKTIYPDFEFLTCSSGLLDYPCNPIYGDTLCSKSLPIACFKDLGLPVPELNLNLSQELRDHVNIYWSGGIIKFTRPIKGQDLKTLNEANNVCTREFGDKWRVLDFHDAGGKNVISSSPDYVPESRFWIDIKDQPKGTCWSREDKPGSSESETAP